MLVVNENIQFLDQHLKTRSAGPFFAYAATDSAHIPQVPSTTCINSIPVNGTQYTNHMDMIYEVDLFFGALIQALKDRDLMKNTIIFSPATMVV